MVRVINQETFDDVVKENMEEFGMTVEEAVEEAVQQFEAQGVNLSNIVKSGAMAEGKDPVKQCVGQLQDLVKLKSLSPVNVADLLRSLKEECGKDLARKVMAGKQGAYPVVLDVLDRMIDDTPTVVLCLQTLVSLTDGYPDLLDKRGVDAMTSLLHSSKNNEIVKNVLKWARLCCINHEHNRQMIVDQGIINELKTLFEKEEPCLLTDMCGLMRALTLDDDVRVDVSKAHHHASSLAISLLCPLTNLLAQHKSNKPMASELLMTMNCLVVRNEYCAKVEEAGGIPFVIDVLTEFPDDERVVRNGLTLLKGLAGNDDVKNKIVQAGVPSLVLLALSRHQKSAEVCNAGLSCVTILSLRSQANSKLFVDQGAADIIMQIMKIHKTNVKVQKNCCWAIRNIVGRSPDLRPAFLKLDAEDLINATQQRFPEIIYDAKAALRDLGCKVDLNEQWKGTGKSIAN